MAQSTAEPSPLAPHASTSLVLAFVNTRENGSQPELLNDARALARWLRSAELADEDIVVTDADAAAARELREALAVLLREHAGFEDTNREVEVAERHLHRSAELHPLVPLISRDGCEWVSRQVGVAGAIGTILAAVADTTARGVWARVKMCSNRTCQVSFFDKTRNSAGRYCNSTCGTQVAMRAYRRRKKNS